MTKYQHEFKAAHIERACKRVQFTTTPITDYASFMAAKALDEQTHRSLMNTKYQAARARAIKILEEGTARSEANEAQKIEFKYRQEQAAYLKHVDKRVYGKHNIVSCQKCSTVAVLNTVLGKDFYYCRTCKDEV